MSNWNSTDLDRIDEAGEVNIATQRRDGSFRSEVPIWIVRVGDELIIRSYRGPEGSWYRNVRRHPVARVAAGGHSAAVRLEPADDGLRAAIDEAYRAKYGSGPYVDAMVTPSGADAALRLLPAE